LYWVKNEPEFGKQAVFLDEADKAGDLPGLDKLKSYKADGIQIVAPPLFALLDAKDGKLVPSEYAKNAKAAGLGIITWTLERSGRLADGKSGWYYQTFSSAINREGDMMQVLDVLAKDVGIMGIFSDWPATVTYYANCVGLK
jgi:glycerophosphoryl diester phosphodiesterase